MIEREIVKVLASQGFLPTAVGGPMPALAILITWGSAVLDTSEISMPPLPQPSFGAPADPTALPPPPPPDTVLLAYNQREIASLVGADKANRNLLDSSRLAEINDAASTSRVYIFIGAFGIETMLKKKAKEAALADANEHPVDASLAARLDRPHAGQRGTLPRSRSRSARLHRRVRSPEGRGANGHALCRPGTGEGQGR